jgi:beta-lactamase superfamily II metal-dependent hydrolase
MWLGYSSVRTALSSMFERIIEKVQRWIPETREIELLRDGGVTSPSNETSLVLYGVFSEPGRVLFTGDAGVNALTWAANYADERGLPLRKFAFVQVPHHGSRRNVGPTILNRIIGPIQPTATQRFVAYISAPPNDDTHPRRIVVNAFIRRGGTVVATQGQNKLFYGGFPQRPGYVDVVPLQLSTEVEEYD